MRGSVVPAMFLFVLLNTLLVEDETFNALVVVWFGNGARSVPRDTAQTERILMRLVDNSSPDSRLHQSRKRVFPRHPVLSLFSLVVFASVARTRCPF